MEDWKICVVSWNLADVVVESEESLSQLLVTAIFDCGLVVFCLQEVGFSARAFLSSRVWGVEPVTTFLRRVLSAHDFVHVSCSWASKPRMLGLLTLVFLKRNTLGCLDKVEMNSIKTGLAGFSGHKGSVGVHLVLKDETRITVVNSHFSPNNENLAFRIREYRGVLEQLKFNGGAQAKISDDYVFWAGDFNFRVDFYSIPEAVKLASDPAECLQRLLPHDQLTRCRNSKEAFHHFQEGEINFPPTYRFKHGTSEYDAQRLPSWCDRIFWRVEEIAGVAKSRPPGLLDCRQLWYRCLGDVCLSDHKPVAALFSVKLPRPSTLSGWAVEFLHPASTVWLTDQSNLCQFRFGAGFVSSAFDWVAIYQPDFTSDTEDVITWCYVMSSWEQEGGRGFVNNILFKPQQLPPPGPYIIGYFSRARNCLQGLSFPIQLSRAKVDQADEACE